MKGRDDMNIFKHRDCFFGCLNSGDAEDSLLSLFRLAKQIKLRLGKQGYLLDCYLSLVFEGLTSGVSYDAADEGVQAGGDSQSFFFSLLDGIEPKHPHPLEGRMREVYEQQADSLDFQERYTKLCLLLFPIADELLSQATTNFVKEQVSGLNGVVDEIRLQKLFDQIAHLAGEAMLEELNAKIRKRFLIAPLAVVFAQGMTDDLLCRLISRDNETSKQMFQLLLDSMPDTP
jgi:hypothetical protein